MSIYDFFENLYYLISRQKNPNIPDLILKQWRLLNPGDKVIDVGAGNGDLALKLLHRIDVSFALLDIDREKLASIPPNPSISIHTTDGINLNFPDESFDTAFCTVALHHFESQGISLKEMVRVLRKNGKLLIVEYDRKSLLTRTYIIIARIQKRHCHFFTLKD